MPLCPKCKTNLGRITYEGLQIFNCGGCGGHVLKPERLDVILERREVKMPEAVRVKMMELANRSNSREALWCYRCGVQMVKEQFQYWPEIVLDRCPKCQDAFLDPGELETVQIYWEHAKDHPEEWGDDAINQRRELIEQQFSSDDRSMMESLKRRYSDPKLIASDAANIGLQILFGLLRR
ncbi:MAG: zf-TFIIB domain-containing protein [Phycisphaerales bacterium]|nr:zf-TFIIB domain-containing protein [Phycisphaerales bacterium]